MNRIIAAALAATLCAQAASAQSAPPAEAERLTLPRALELAGAGAPAIEAAEAGVRAAAAQRRVAGLRPNPTAGLEAENVAGTGQYSGVDSVEATASLSLTIELGGKRAARIGVADAQTRRARLAATAAEADLTLRVTQAFNLLSAAELRATVVREQAGFAEEGLRAARVRVRAGRASPLEEQRAEVARVNAVTAADRADRASRLARANLARLIGRDPGAIDTAWFDRLSGGVGPRLEPSADGTLGLAAAKAEASIADAQVRLARSQRIGDLTVSAGARRLEATNDVAAVVGVSIPLPLFNNGRAAIDAASAQRDQAAAAARAARLDAQQAIAEAGNEVADAEANARNASGPALAAAQEAARIARIGYREGKFGQLDLLEAERTLAETKGAVIDALTAYHDAQARLQRLTTPAPASEQGN